MQSQMNDLSASVSSDLKALYKSIIIIIIPYNENTRSTPTDDATDVNNCRMKFFYYSCSCYSV